MGAHVEEKFQIVQPCTYLWLRNMNAHVEEKLQVMQPCTYLWFRGKHGRPC